MGAVDFDAAQGAAKEVYDESGVKDWIPACGIITRDFAWEQMARTGKSYKYSIVASPPNGFTYPGSSGAIVSQKTPRNMVLVDAEVVPYEINLREQYSWAAVSRLLEEGKASFVNLTMTIQKAMKKSAATRAEAVALMGQSPLAEVEAVADGGSSTMVVTITEETWRPGFWWAVGMNSTYDSWTSNTQNNATAALVLIGINAAERKLTFSHGGTYSSECAAGDNIYFEGAKSGSSFKEAPGIIVQASALTGTSPTGISLDDYPQLQGNVLDLDSNPFSTDVAEQACGQLRDRGAEGIVRCYLPNKTYGEIANEVRANQAIQLQYNAERQKFGQSGFVQESKQVGPIEYVNHPFLALGEFLMCGQGAGCRGGSSDFTPTMPGMDGTKLWRLLDGQNGAELGMFADMFTLLKAPPHALYGTGVSHPS